jgi:apolipoprotein N-acyltransferase
VTTGAQPLDLGFPDARRPDDPDAARPDGEPDPAPVDPAPVDPAPVDPAPVDPAPVAGVDTGASEPHAVVTLPRERSLLAGLGSLLAGLLVGLSLPPWGWWPLAFGGLALYTWLLRDRPWRSRWVRGFLFTFGWLGPALAWMWFLTPPGYVVSVALFAVVHAAAAAVARRGRWQWISLPAAFTLAEALRFCFPFGGVPLASLAISQVAGPLAPIARVGGPLLLTFMTVFAAQGLLALTAVVRQSTKTSIASGEAARSTGHSPDQAWQIRRLLVIGLTTAAVTLVASIPLTHPAGRSITVAFVQGGGPQGTHAIHTDARVVVDRHLAATRRLLPGPDLVVWPENVINVDNFADSPEHGEITAEARRLGAPIVVGITEETVDHNHFLNAQVVVLPDGTISSRYDKVRRVPFGEYVPMRGLLESLGAPLDAIPRDAVAGTGPAYLDTPFGRVAVVISWEVFFAGRARDGVKRGAELIINPTNGSSYTWTILQSQQIASSRLRAIETDRWLVQVAPTGFSAFVSPGGDVSQRTRISEQAIRQQAVQLRTGETLAVRIGDKPWVVLAFLLLAVTIALSRRRPPIERLDRSRTATTSS